MEADETRKVTQSFVYRGDAAWFVSTVDRVSSAMLAQGARYHETLVWTMDSMTHGRLALIWQGEAVRGSLRTHEAVCRRLYETGSPEEPEDDHAN